MTQPTDFGSYLRENKALLQQYVETRMEIIRLQLIRATARAMGSLIWLIVFLFLVFLLLIFIGLVLGFLFSEITGSHVVGFLIAAGILLLFTLILTLFRKFIFINPAVRLLVGIFARETEEEDDMDDDDYSPTENPL